MLLLSSTWGSIYTFMFDLIDNKTADGSLVAFRATGINLTQQVLEFATAQVPELEMHHNLTNLKPQAEAAVVMKVAVLAILNIVNVRESLGLHEVHQLV